MHVRKCATATGVWGHAPPCRNFLKFRGYEIASETYIVATYIFGPIRCFSEVQTTQFQTTEFRQQSSDKRVSHAQLYITILSAHCVVQTPLVLVL